MAEGNGKSVRRFSHAGTGIKALAVRRARAALDRFLGIERRFSGNFVEQFTHAVLYRI